VPGWLWIVIAVAVVVVTVIVVLALTKGRETQRQRKRANAEVLRQEAAQRLSKAGRHEAAAREEEEWLSVAQAEAEQIERELRESRARAEAAKLVARREAEEAKRLRAEAEKVARRAEELDPDRPDPGEDFDAADALRNAHRDAGPGTIDEDGTIDEETQDVDVVQAPADDETSGITPRDDGERPGTRRA
jgi:hypothetical protein